MEIEHLDEERRLMWLTFFLVVEDSGLVSKLIARNVVLRPLHSDFWQKYRESVVHFVMLKVFSDHESNYFGVRIVMNVTS